MKWNKHWELEGKHAQLSPSGYHWLGYSPEKMRTVYINMMKKEKGTKLHQLASDLINERIQLRPLKKAFNMFVNDSIGFMMSSEVLLKYSEFCFGTADAIRYDEQTKTLKVFDLKTGSSKPSFNQLNIYAALFCLEYGYKPEKMSFETRLYQKNGYEISNPTGEEIRGVMNQIKLMDDTIRELLSETGGEVYE